MADDKITSDYEARLATQDSPDYIIRLSKFDGGLVDSMEDDLLKTEESSRADGVAFDNHIINLMKGSQYYGDAPISGSFQSLFFFVKY